MRPVRVSARVDFEKARRDVRRTREYARRFPETPTKLQRSHYQEYLCDVSAAETFCDASAEEIQAGFEGIREKGEKKAKKGEKRPLKNAKRDSKTHERSGATEKEKAPTARSSGGAAAAATSPAKTSDASMPRVHSGKVAKRDRLLIRYIDAGA